MKTIFLRLADKGEIVSEGMQITFLVGGLPRPEYNNFVLFTQQTSNKFNDYVTRLLDYARSEPAIPGSLHPSALKDIAHSSREHGKMGNKGKKQFHFATDRDMVPMSFIANDCHKSSPPFVDQTSQQTSVYMEYK
jgi:hypothetical protein